MIRILLSSRLGDRKWTQADLARKTGIRPTTINELYHEMVDRVNLDHLDLICEALDCSLDELIVRVPNKTPRTTPLTVHKSQKLTSRELQLLTCLKKGTFYRTSLFYTPANSKRVTVLSRVYPDRLKYIPLGWILHTADSVCLASVSNP